MLTKTDTKIIEFLIKNQQERFSIRELSRQIKTDYKLVYSSIKRLTEKKVINKEKHGKMELCTLNTKDSTDYLTQVENIKAKRFLEKNTGIRLIIKEIKEKIRPYSTLMIFGSYAKEQPHKMSDLDLLIIGPDKKFINETEAIVNTVAMIKPIKIHSLIITAENFKEMLVSKEKLNIAKEVLSNHIIFHGAEAYYKLLEVL